MSSTRFHIHHFEVLNSTQVEARHSRYQPGDLVIADSQSGGYGRRGRSWASPKGNLYMTLVENFQGISQLAWLPYAVGLGLYEAVQPFLAADADLRLKWPNDLLINAEKLSGILLEVVDNHLLIGVGMNVAILPETDQPVTMLKTHAANGVQAIDVAEAFLPRYNAWYQIGLQKGFAHLRDTWLSRAAFLSKTITARLADGSVITGTFRDLDPTGALVLTNESGHHVITTADIYLKKED